METLIFRGTNMLVAGERGRPCVKPKEIRLLALVTGASRGFGKCVAEEFVRQVAFSNAVDLVIVGQCGPDLKSVAGAIDVIPKKIPDVSEVVVRREVVDLRDLERFDNHLDKIFSGSGEDVPCLKSRAAETPLEGGGGAHDDAAPKRNAPDASNNVVVNASSLCAVNFFETSGGYCSDKAARDMFHRVLAEEQMKVGGLKVLNYSPGLMQTEMAREIRTEAQYEGDLRNGGLLDPKISAEKSVGLVHDGGFESGAHVDFFDE